MGRSNVCMKKRESFTNRQAAIALHLQPTDIVTSISCITYCIVEIRARQKSGDVTVDGVGWGVEARRMRLRYFLH